MLYVVFKCHYYLLLFKTFILFFILICLSAGMCMHHVYAVPAVDRRERTILWNRSYRWL